KKALGEAVQEFLRIVQDELELRCEVPGAQIRDNYQLPMKKFIQHQEVKPLLGKAFAKDCRKLDSKQLGKIWRQYYPQAMPTEFDWDRVAQQYLIEVKRIVKQSPALKTLLELETLEAIEKNTQETAGIIPDFNLKAYQEGLQERYANLNLDSLDTSVYDYREKLKVWQVFVPQNVRECQEFLPQVYEIPKEHQRRLRESNELEAEIDSQTWERYKKIYYEQPVRSILDLVNQIWENTSDHYLVILGDPGSGKSMFLQYLALNWARSPLDNAIELPIPLLIELRTYNRDRNSKCKDLLEFFHKGNVICRLNQHQLQEKLKAGKVLVMFDGLDEVFEPTQRDQVITDIHRFTNEYPQVRVIVTSRIIGYKPQRLRDAEFRHFLLQDLDSEQIKNFIYRWHELTFIDETDKLRKRERLQQSIDNSKAIAELAGNPLLLTMMAILNRNQELPRDRPELYNQASRVLLHQWDVERNLLADPRINPVTIDYKDKQAMLRQIAHFMQAADKGLAGNLIRGRDLEGILIDYLDSIKVGDARTVARLLIEQLRSRNFILCFLGGDSYGFVHRTFLEYFCAWEHVWQFQQTQRLSIEELKTEVFGKHWQDESWHEVLRLIAGMIDARFTGEIIEYLISQDGEGEKFSNLFLAAECLAEVRNLSGIATTADKLLELIKGLTKYDFNYDYESSGEEAKLRDIRTKAVAAVAMTWQEHPETLALLKKWAQSDRHGYVRSAAVEKIARGWKDDPDTLTLLKHLAQSDEDGNVRSAVVIEIARGWKDDPDTLPLLQKWAQSDKNWLIGDAVVGEIARGWKDKPDTLPLLQQWAQFSKNWLVGIAAVGEIARGWKDKPEILPLLKKWAQSDRHGYVRSAAVEKIARGWKNEPDTLPLLQKLAQFDDDKDVRSTAVEEISRGSKDEPDTLPLLQKLAQFDDDGNVRRAAVEAIAHYGWKDEPDTLPLLQKLAQSDKNWLVRRAAVEVIARVWKDNPDTLPLLQQSAQSDKNEYVRHAAVEVIARDWKDNPDTLPLLQQWAQFDKDGNVRSIAVEAIARYWKDESDTLPLLQQLTQSNEDGNIPSVAVREIARGWKDDPNTLPLLQELAQSDQDGNVRSAAVREIARGWKNDPNTLPLLQELAQSDQDGNVRSAAVREIARGWKNDPNTLPLLQELAQSDQDGNVRSAAVRGIARGWKDDPNTLPLLQKSAQSDKDGNVRHATVREIVRGWEDNSETLPLLQKSAQSDEYWDLRYTAVEEIARGWKDEPWMLGFLCDRVLNDPFERQEDWEDNPRQLALRIIIEKYPNNPQILPLLRDKAENDSDEQLREFASQKLAEFM
ncbi:MAG: NACHT domain-containing protein, partial [Symploca sp. SIO1B1]|nr:NACHT domain-containing protein [Symploca sp. SIO1B1]